MNLIWSVTQAFIEADFIDLIMICFEYSADLHDFNDPQQDKTCSRTCTCVADPRTRWWTIKVKDAVKLKMSWLVCWTAKAPNHCAGQVCSRLGSWVEKNSGLGLKNKMSWKAKLLNVPVIYVLSFTYGHELGSWPKEHDANTGSWNGFPPQDGAFP